MSPRTGPPHVLPQHVAVDVDDVLPAGLDDDARHRLRAAFAGVYAQGHHDGRTALRREQSMDRAREDTTSVGATAFAHPSEVGIDLGPQDGYGLPLASVFVRQDHAEHLWSQLGPDLTGTVMPREWTVRVTEAPSLAMRAVRQAR